MRTVVFAINVSADGCCDHAMFNPDDEVLDYFTRLTQDADVLLYGRKTYELMVPYWPEIARNQAGQSQGDIEFAQAFASVPRIVVFSKTLSGSQGEKTTIIRANPRDEIQKLKQGQGGNILTGGVSLPGELLELGLIDEVRLVVHPVITGKGRRLFDSVNLPETLQFKCTEPRVFKSGCVALRYLKASGPTG
jgi:dihydrofolate reductase